jgi:hypothetical protein
MENGAAVAYSHRCLFSYTSFSGEIDMTRVAVTVREGRELNRRERGVNKVYKGGDTLTVSEHTATAFADALQRTDGPAGQIPPRDLPAVPGTDDARTDEASDAAALAEQGQHDDNHLAPAARTSLDATDADPVSFNAKLASLADNGTPDPRNPDAKVAQPQNTDAPAGSAESQNANREGVNKDAARGGKDPAVDSLVTGLASVDVKVNPDAVAGWSDAERERAQAVIDRKGKGNLPQFILAAKVD